MFTTTAHFEGKDPEVRKIYDRLVNEVRKFGRVSEDPKKTSIHLVNKTAFAGVATRKGALVLTVKSDRAIQSPRIHKSEQASAHRYHHQIKLAHRLEIDRELLMWLRNAWELSN